MEARRHRIGPSKTRSQAVGALLVLTCLLGKAQPLHAQGTAFTYQGRLTDAGQPANGSYDMTFALFNTSTGVGTQVGVTVTNVAVPVANGLFTVRLDFGPSFPGADRWLEIGVRANGGQGFTTLSPRQQLSSAPYAVTAGNLSGTLPAGQLSGTLPSALLSGNYSGAVNFVCVQAVPGRAPAPGPRGCHDRN
jgi:hypothetical protein